MRGSDKYKICNHQRCGYRSIPIDHVICPKCRQYQNVEYPPTDIAFATRLSLDNEGFQTVLRTYMSKQTPGVLLGAFNVDTNCKFLVLLACIKCRYSSTSIKSQYGEFGLALNDFLGRYNAMNTFKNGNKQERSKAIETMRMVYETFTGKKRQTLNEKRQRESSTPSRTNSATRVAVSVSVANSTTPTVSLSIDNSTSTMGMYFCSTEFSRGVLTVLFHTLVQRFGKATTRSRTRDLATMKRSHTLELGLSTDLVRLNLIASMPSECGNEIIPCSQMQLQ